MNTIALADLNTQVRNAQELLIIDSETAYDRKLRQIADDICRHASEKPIILLAGPSGSGKTSTAKRIEYMLDAAGYETHSLAMDDYYADGTRNLHIVDENGNPDYESPQRLDLDLLNTQLRQLARGETVELPCFDFARQKQMRSGRMLRRKPHDLIIMEGIHALNPDVTGDAQDQTARIYISVRTRITDGVRVLHPSMIRFARRVLRDSRSRGRTPQETLALLESISRGENRYIMPYKSRASYEIDSFLPYELSVYRPYLLEIVRELCKDADPTDDIQTLCAMLETLEPLPSDYVPDCSLVREFIGQAACRK